MVPNLTLRVHQQNAILPLDFFDTVYVYASGGLLFLVCGAIAAISSAFDYGTQAPDHPVVLFVGLYAVAGLICLPLVTMIPSVSSSRHLLLFVLLIGALSRLVFFPSTPIYEDDFYRYLWDGAVAAHGIDPFKYPPSDFLPEDPELTALLGPSNALPSAEQLFLEGLAKESGVVIERVNYPYIKTEYPLVAQAAFALSYAIAPWSLIGWRIICLLCELLSLFLILRTLTSLNLSPLWAITYWWNPIAIVEIANRVHMEALLVPALLAVVYFAIKQKAILSSVSLAVAVGVKFWPALLLPLVLRNIQHGRQRQFLGALSFCLLCAALLLPQVPNGLDTNSGLITYSQSWQTNSFAFGVFETIFSSIPNIDADLAARLFVFFAVSACAIAAALPTLQSRRDLIGRLLLVSTSLFLLSPTQYPWYFLWILPFLIYLSVWPLLAIAVTIPLYFTRYYFAHHQMTEIFERFVVPLQFLPIFLFLGIWYWQSKVNNVRSHHATQY